MILIGKAENFSQISHNFSAIVEVEIHALPVSRASIFHLSSAKLTTSIALPVKLPARLQALARHIRKVILSDFALTNFLQKYQLRYGISVNDIGSQLQFFCRLPSSHTHTLFGILRLGYFPHPPSASNIAPEIGVCKGENKDVFITTLFSEFTKNR